MGDATYDSKGTMLRGALTRPEQLHLADELRMLLHGVRLTVARGDEETAHAAADVGATDAALAAAIARSRAALDEARALLAEGECMLAALEELEDGADG